MNLTQIFEMQKELDKAINRAHQLDNTHKDIVDQAIIAIIVEISEFANEIKSFKYWKKNKEVNKQKLLEEYIDGIHFLTSFAIMNNVSPIINARKISDDINYQFLSCYEKVLNFHKQRDAESCYELFSIYLGFSQLLGFSENDILDAYISKNSVNFERIRNNY